MQFGLLCYKLGEDLATIFAPLVGLLNGEVKMTF